MNRRNWLSLGRKLVDKYDWDFSINSIQQALGEAALSYWGKGVLATTTYPNPFPVTVVGLSGSVGNGIAYDPNGQITRIDTASTTSKVFTIAAYHPTHPRWDLLVLRYKATGDTAVPKPSDPITTIFLNIHDDFELAIIAGTPSATPSYPAKGPLDIILTGLRVDSGSVPIPGVVIDETVRERGMQATLQNPKFVQEAPVGAIDGSNVDFVMSFKAITNESVMVRVNDRTLTNVEWTIVGQTITLVTAPALGQDVWVYYIKDDPQSQNPLAAFQEIPATLANGIITDFPLLGRPADQNSTIVFVDGSAVSSDLWDLVQGITIGTIKFKPAAIPAAGQSVYVWYLINPATVGVGYDNDIALSGGLTLDGSVGAPVVISPASGIPVASNARQIIWVRSVSGAQVVTASPQIMAGSTVGQELIVRGTSDTNYPILNDGNGLSLNGTINLTSNESLFLVWDGLVWAEITRR